MSSTWVIGRRGLLGSALLRTLGRRHAAVFQAGAPGGLDWTQAEGLAAQIAAATRLFAQSLPRESQQPWTVYWAAGVGTMGASATDMEPEALAFAALLDALAAQPELKDLPGHVVLASSAGALYAGSPEALITEATPTAPTTAYGRAKAAQEAQLADWLAHHPACSGLALRLSTLYGPGQSSKKQQGLISHLARQSLRHLPIHIFVPLDTLRDYLHADDAAEAMWLASQQSRPAGVLDVRLLASEQAISVAEIVATFRRVVRRAPLIVTSNAPASALYRRAVVFRSEHTPWEGASAPRRTPLAVGLAQVMESERRAWVGSLPTG